jgi:small-conductance mechanosensitive channel/CRP-like cAMP-binding protein
MQTIASFLHQDYALSLFGLLFATGLLLFVRMFVPPDERGQMRIASIYLVLAFVVGLALVVIPGESQIARTFEFFWWFFVLASIGRSLVILFIDVIFARRTHQTKTSPRIFRDLTQAVVYIIVLMMTLRAVGVEPGSLLTTSALLTAVIGLSLQDTLGNLVSGLALQLQRPFQVGDWIQFEADLRSIGQVTEVNWRATTVMTSDLVELIVPNATLAKSSIRNYSRPSKVSRRSVTVQGPYEVPPHRVHEAIVKVLEETPGILKTPPPWVQTSSFADSGIEYTVWYFMDDFASRVFQDGLVRDRVWYAMSRAGIGIPYPIRMVHAHQVSEATQRREHERELERRDRILGSVDFLDVLPKDAHRALADQAEVRLFGPGEVIVRQGETANEMFIIDRGEVAVEIHAVKSSKPRQLSVAKLGPGKFFGEMALLTGEPRKATVRATSECALLVIGHGAFHDVVAVVPEVVEKVSALVAQRQEELEAVSEGSRPSLDPTPERSARLLSQIRQFFKL